MGMRRVVVGIEATGDESALDLALDEALRRRLPLEVVHVYQLPAYGDLTPFLLPRLERLRPDAVAATEAAVARAVHRVTAAETVDVRVRVVEGRTADRLVEASQAAALVVLGRRGGGAVTRGLRGSVSSEVLHHCSAPVALVPPRTSRVVDRGTASRVVVGLDGSPASTTALTWAVAQALEWGSALVPVVVLSDRGALPAPLADRIEQGRHALAAEIWRRVRAAGGEALEAHPETPRGSPVHELLRVPTPEDLLVLGSRGRAAALRSTSVEVAERCAAPVVVVREGQARREIHRRVSVAGGPW